MGYIFGSSSGLYDKYLIQNAAFNPQTVQFWFSVYVVIIVLTFLLVTWLPYKAKRSQFKFRWSIIAVGVLLRAGLYCYQSLTRPDALIMILSAVKRSQIIISVIIGGFNFKEKNKRKKLIPLLGILLGVALILYTKS